MRPPLITPARDLPTATLTAIQREIVGMLAEGLTNQAIASRLGVARETVSEQIAMILWRLGLTTHAEITLGRAQAGMRDARSLSGGASLWRMLARSVMRAGRRTRPGFTA